MVLVCGLSVDAIVILCIPYRASLPLHREHGSRRRVHPIAPLIKSVALIIKELVLGNAPS